MFARVMVVCGSWNVARLSQEAAAARSENAIRVMQSTPTTILRLIGSPMARGLAFVLNDSAFFNLTSTINHAIDTATI